jgi:hypothetical protein
MSPRTAPLSPVRHFVGLDLGQAQDFTAVAVLERPMIHPRARLDDRRPAYALRHLRRFPPGTPYPNMFAEVRTLLRTPPIPGSVVAVDQTGVGRAVVDLLSEHLQNQVTCTFCPVTITTGHAPAMQEGAGLLLPKKELVGAL